ncbi:MAG: adenylyl-sulfate kinase [Proteobacteria bacterium]|nr:adenylyl-sulfate kinase [Pseudomonadota bacterium]
MFHGYLRHKKARSGQIPNMTGINSPYEPPLDPDVVLSKLSARLEEAAESIGNLL